MPSRTRVSLTREGYYYLVVFLLVLVGAMVREANLLLLLAGTLLGPLLLSSFLALRTLRGLEVERRLPRAVCAGDMLVVNLQLNNPRRWLGCWSIVVEDTLTRVAIDESKSASPRRGKDSTVVARALFTYVAARESSKLAYRGRLPRRGKYRFGPLKMSTRFPFGLFRFTMLSRASQATKTANRAQDNEAPSILVLPKLGKLTRRWMMRQHESFSGAHHRERTPGQDGDFFGVRPWQRGDRRSLLHARTTARLGAPMVRQFEQPRNRDLALVIDLGRAALPSSAKLGNVELGNVELEYMELAISFAATVVCDLCRRGGSEIYLVIADAEPAISGGPASDALMQEMLARLALVEGGRSSAIPSSAIPSSAIQSSAMTALLDLAVNKVDIGAELVVISTQPCDLSNLAVNPDLARRIQNRSIRVVDVSSAELTQYYHAE